jgi:cation diffusion facilitator CzcD-associated flavoprotein CzcO
MTSSHVDVLVVGAGISGICAGYHLQKSCPDRTYAILEQREAIGGTWDLFRYPGIRSDSDMYTLGFSFKPWTNPRAIADGPSILAYLRETAAEYGIDRKIRFGHTVKRASWSSEDARWTVEVERGERKELVHFTCNFLFMCSGYYDYAQGYTPDFPGIERFRGRVVHPQLWTKDVDYAGKRVVVIGSGATAVTLVPSMAPAAAHVTMLQRSPTYIVSMPGSDRSRTGCAASCRRAPRTASRAGRTFRDPVVLQLLPQEPRAREGDDRPVAPEGDRRRPRETRAPLSASLQPVGAARLSGARRRPLPEHARREGLDRHGPDRDVHRNRHQAALGAGAAGRPRHHRDRPQPATARRPRGDDRRTPRRVREDVQLQGHDVQRRAEPGARGRVHERVVDAQGGADLPLRLPPA